MLTMMNGMYSNNKVRSCFVSSSRRMILLFLIVILPFVFTFQQQWDQNNNNILLVVAASSAEPANDAIVAAEDSIDNEDNDVSYLLPNEDVMNHIDDHTNRELQTTSNTSYYFTTTKLGARNIAITSTNPMKGLTADPNIRNPYASGIHFSLEHVYVGLDQVLTGPNTYDWTYFENLLNQYVTRNTHAIPRFFIHYPGEVIALPNYLIDRIEYRYYKNLRGDFGISPYYGDVLLLKTITEFIIAFGKRYDNDYRIAFIQGGLIGFWGEHHCSGNNDFIPIVTIENLVQEYQKAFKSTPIQIRYPDQIDTSITHNIGYHDDSFTYTTLDGIYNGNVYKNWYFWNQVISTRQEGFWKYAVMVRIDTYIIVFFLFVFLPNIIKKKSNSLLYRVVKYDLIILI